MDVEIWDDLLIYNKNFTVSFINKVLIERKLNGLRFFCLFDEDLISDLSFLSEIQNLKKLSIFIKVPIDFNVLYNLTDLESLHIQTLFSPIDFGKLLNIKFLNIEWNEENIVNLHLLYNLKELTISNFNKPNLVYFSKLIAIEKLSLIGSKLKNLDGIQGINLKALSVSNDRHLTGIEQLENIINLKYLVLNLCPRVTNLSVLSTLKELFGLELIDCKNIIEWDFISLMPALKQIFISGSTNKNNNCINFPKTLEYAFGNLGGNWTVNNPNYKRITFNRVS
jgi:hypothetical protein